MPGWSAPNIWPTSVGIDEQPSTKWTSPFFKLISTKTNHVNIEKTWLRGSDKERSCDSSGIQGRQLLGFALPYPTLPPMLERSGAAAEFLHSLSTV